MYIVYFSTKIVKIPSNKIKKGELISNNKLITINEKAYER